MNYYKLLSLNLYKKNTEQLFFFYNNKKLKFKIKRFYFFKNIKSNTSRANHAHKKTKQIFVCLKGSVTVKLSNRKKVIKIVELKEGNKKVLAIIKPTWLELLNFSKNCILLVLADRDYNKSDYIYNKNLVK
jgi:dTDP-4-dehydrorhamnose 3,5-epimerase-like enzyme